MYMLLYVIIYSYYYTHTAHMQPHRGETVTYGTPKKTVLPGHSRPSSPGPSPSGAALSTLLPPTLLPTNNTTHQLTQQHSTLVKRQVRAAETHVKEVEGCASNPTETGFNAVYNNKQP